MLHAVDFENRTLLNAAYDMEHDPEEKENLYQKRPDMVDSLSTLLDKYKHQGYTRPQNGQ